MLIFVAFRRLNDKYGKNIYGGQSAQTSEIFYPHCEAVLEMRPQTRIYASV